MERGTSYPTKENTFSWKGCWIWVYGLKWWGIIRKYLRKEEEKEEKKEGT